MRYSTIFSPQILAFLTSVCLCNMLTVAEAMSASMHWNFLAQYSILKQMFADLRSIATTWCKQTAGSPTEPMEEGEEESMGAEKEEEHEQSGGSALGEGNGEEGG